MPTVISGVLATSAITNSHNWLTIVAAVCLTVAFLFHIRVVDEVRDYVHDNEFHPDRPVQQGIISIKELKILRRISLMVFFGITLFFFPETFIFAIALFIYSSVAARDFFYPERIRRHFLTYNLLNMIQLIGLQFVALIMFGWDLHFTPTILIYISIVFLLSGLLEVVRKIKLSQHETDGRDTYSSRLGFGYSIGLLIVIQILVFLLFKQILILSPEVTRGIVIPIIVFICALCVSFVHYLNKTERTEKLLLLAGLLYYCAIDLSLYFLL
jgi:4-hydroxybenzoate polyprenyltransferase